MKLAKHAFVFASVLALGCGTATTGDGPLDPEANPEDFPAIGVSEACGGKCDSPEVLLNVSASRLIANLDMIDFAAADGESESFSLVAGLVELGEDEAAVEEGATLTLALAAVDGAANPDFKIPAELVFDGENFVSGTIDSSELIPWQLMRIDVTGLHGDREINQIFEYAPGFEFGAELIPEPEPSADPFADALDVTLPVIFIDPAAETPGYDRPSVDNFSLGGTEFWQRWDGGHSPTFSYSAGTEAGRKCMFASARRFEAIMAEAPESMNALKANSNWSGSFFNWNDDFSDESATRRPRGAVLWAWRTGLIKWISQTGSEGECFLPTLDQVERAAANCQSKADSGEGEIEGCQAG